jgi:hypothetical protein
MQNKWHSPLGQFEPASDGRPIVFLEGDGFSVSYNLQIDKSAIYRSETGDINTFFRTLSGDHRKQFLALVPQGYTACLLYYVDCRPYNIILSQSDFNVMAKYVLQWLEDNSLKEDALKLHQYLKSTRDCDADIINGLISTYSISFSVYYDLTHGSTDEDIIDFTKSLRGLVI